MLRVTFVRVAEENVARLRAWLDLLTRRRTELEESYRRQQTRHELFYLVESGLDPVLAIVTESADLEAGAKEFLGSDLAIDVAFKELIQEIGVEEPVAELIFDSRDVVPAAAAPRSGEAGADER